MSKKRINKIKSKQKQKQKQMQIVNVNIHKPTRRPREAPSQPRRNVQQLPTPQYIYTSQIDSLVPQMFNKEGKQENIPTLTEQINKTFDEKINKLVSQYGKPPQPAQPTQEEVRQTRTTKFERNVPFERNVLFNKPNKPELTKKNEYTNIFNEPKEQKNKQEMIQEYIKNKSKQEVPKVFQAETYTPLTNIQYEKPVENEPILSKREPETISSIYKKNQPEQPEQPETIIKPIKKTTAEIEKSSRDRKKLREKIIKIDKEIVNKKNEIIILESIYHEQTLTDKRKNTTKKKTLKNEINVKTLEREQLMKKLNELAIYKKKSNEIIL